MSKDIYICKNCQEEFIPKQKEYSTFCSRKCSVSYNNRKRKRTKESNEKTRQSMIEYHKTQNKNYSWIKSKKNPLSPNNKNNIFGIYTRIYYRKCKHCERKFYSRNLVKYCNLHSNLYKNKNRYSFEFNIYNYPDIFNLSIIKKYGWFNYKTNKNGLTRDHKISINEAIKNNYDPYYIKHPLNCELMFWKDNRRKSNKSSISYEKLINIIEEYESGKN